MSLGWDCGECQAAGSDRERNCAFLDLPAEEWNQAIAWEFDPKLQQCPKSLVGEETETHLGWWQEWKHLGILPWPGGIGDQPALVVEALLVAAAEWADAEKKNQALTESGRMRALQAMFGGKGG